MLTYIIHRLLIMIPTLIVISIVTFVIIQLPEGDYLSNLVKELQAQGEAAALEKVAFLREQYGFDEPAIEPVCAARRRCCQRRRSPLDLTWHSPGH